jgi:hypothetical protein
MKKTFLFVLIAIIFYGCSKSDPPYVATPLPTEWDFNGLPYNGITTTFKGNILYTIDSLGESVTIKFYAPPATNDTYSVSNGYPTAPDYCEIILSGEIILNNPAPPFISTGYYSDKVIVTFLGDKISASFSSILLSNNIGSFPQNFAYISGTLIQQ